MLSCTRLCILGWTNEVLQGRDRDAITMNFVVIPPLGYDPFGCCFQSILFYGRSHLACHAPPLLNWNLLVMPLILINSFFLNLYIYRNDPLLIFFFLVILFFSNSFFSETVSYPTTKHLVHILWIMCMS